VTDTIDRDDRIARALRALEPDAALDDLHYERLARRIGAAGAARLREMSAHTSAPIAAPGARPRGALVRIGVAALVAAACLFAFLLGGGVTPVGTADVRLADPGLHPPDRGSLFAATVGAVNEDEFLRALWGRPSAEALLAASVSP
jgi:hypothetical protein